MIVSNLNSRSIRAGGCPSKFSKSQDDFDCFKKSIGLLEIFKVHAILRIAENQSSFFHLQVTFERVGDITLLLREKESALEALENEARECMELLERIESERVSLIDTLENIRHREFEGLNAIWSNMIFLDARCRAIDAIMIKTLSICQEVASYIRIIF